MVIEHFKNGDARPVYERFKERGRLTPAGLEYVESWVDADLTRCFQLMRTEDPTLLPRWADNWSDLVEFDFIPVLSGREAALRVLDPVTD